MAARYIQKLSKKEQDKPHWQTAIPVLIGAAEGRDFLFHALAAMLQALDHGKPATPEPRRKAAKAYKVIK